ncbi:MAG: CBS domain-containing protein [Pirellulales bacterium]
MNFKVKHAMTDKVVTVRDDASIDEVCDLLLRHHVSGLPVVDAEEQIVGVITEHDLLDLLYNPEMEHAQVADYLTRDVLTVEEGDMLIDTVELLLNRNIRRVPVVRGKKVVGVISRRDVVRYIREVRQRVQIEVEARRKPLTASA